MSPADALATIAEVSVALTGFAAVMALLRGNQQPRGRFRLVFLVQTSSAALILSILAIACLSAGFAPVRV